MAWGVAMKEEPHDSHDPHAALGRLSFLIHVLSTRIALIGYRMFRENGISHFSARILVLLLERGELRISDLVDFLVLPQSTISSQLQIMERKELIVRRRSETDSRSVLISLSPKGASIARACNEVSLQANIEMIDTLDEAQRETTFRALHLVNERLTQMQDRYLGSVEPGPDAADVPEPAPRATRAAKVDPGADG
ncbi:MAG: hypothetical protein RLZ83_10 [Pseudomonadota bacterium]